MNETKSARYHRARRRSVVLSLAGTAAVLALMLWWKPALPIWQYALLLAALNELAGFPVAMYRGHLLERQYGLSHEPFGAWMRDHLKGVALATLFAVAGAEVLYALIRWTPAYWWLTAAVAGTALTAVLTWLAPVALLPLFYRFTPLERPELAARLLALSKKAGVAVLGVYQWGLGDRTRRANAALTGAAGTRRILLSDTLLADYSDDEIEVILAHELAHHVHRDIPKGLAAELVLLLLAAGAAALVLKTSASPLGLTGAADVRGLPLILLAGGAVTLAAAPLLNALSRHNERRADRFAVALTGRADAFASAMKRLGSQNLAEEDPSKLTVWLFHSHPPIEERIHAARSYR